MKNHDENDLIPFTEIPKDKTLVPRRRRGSRISIPTLYRWSRAGVKGVRLRIAYAGATPCTSKLWLREFFEAVAAAKLERPRHVDDAGAKAAEEALHRAGAM